MLAYRSSRIMMATTRTVIPTCPSLLKVSNAANIPVRVQSTALSTRQPYWNGQQCDESKPANKTSLFQTRCPCGAHSIQSVNFVKHLSSASTSLQAEVKQGAILRTDDDDSSFFVKTLDNMGILWKLRYNRFKMRGASQNLYTSCADGIDVQNSLKLVVWMTHYFHGF